MSPGLWLQQGKDRVVYILPEEKRQEAGDKSLNTMITDRANLGKQRREAEASLLPGWLLGGGDMRGRDLKGKAEPGCLYRGEEHSSKCKGPGAEPAHLA